MKFFFKENWFKLCLLAMVAATCFVAVSTFVTKKYTSFTIKPGQDEGQIIVKGSIRNQAQCVADGKIFFQKNWIRQSSSESVWKYEGPQYYLNQKLGTCLFYIREISPLDIKTSSSFYNSFVYDVYKEKIEPVIQSHTTRTCPQGGGCTEVFNYEGVFANAPNLSTGDFDVQKKILFLE